MQSLFLIILSVIGGICFAVQGPVNTALGEKTGVLQASFISFVGGTLLTAVIVLVEGGGNLADITHAKLWQLVGGLYGALNVCVSVAAIPVLGVALALMTILLGQLLMGIIIDRFGLFGSSVMVITPLRIAGILAVGVGILLIYIAGRSEEQRSKNNKTIFYLVLSFAAGMLGTIQTPTNASLAKIIGSWESTMVSFIVGSIGIAIVLLVTCRGKWISSTENLKQIKWWMLCGGAFGVIGIFLNLYSVTVLGAALQVVCSMLGQLGGSLIIDTFGLIRTPKRQINAFRVLGVAVICAGLVIVSLA